VDEADFRSLISGGRQQTNLNVTANHVDASHSTFMDFQGGQTNVFSNTNNTYIVSGVTLSYRSIVIDTKADL
jgi:hypothetical protein